MANKKTVALTHHFKIDVTINCQDAESLIE